MLKVLVWLYESPTGHRRYTPDHVKLFMRQFSDNYSQPHQFFCITDQSPYLFRDVDINIIPMPESLYGLENNYRRLWVFSQEAAEVISGRVFMSDIDVMILDWLDEYLDRPEPLVLMTDPTQKGPNYKYSPPCILDMGARPDIWDEFMNSGSVKRMKEYYLNECGQGRMTGSDMAWLSYYFKDEEVPSFNQYRARNLNKVLPEDAFIVHYSGKKKPWKQIEQKYSA